VKPTHECLYYWPLGREACRIWSELEQPILSLLPEEWIRPWTYATTLVAILYAFVFLFLFLHIFLLIVIKILLCAKELYFLPFAVFCWSWGLNLALCLLGRCSTTSATPPGSCFCLFPKGQPIVPLLKMAQLPTWKKSGWGKVFCYGLKQGKWERGAEPLLERHVGRNTEGRSGVLGWCLWRRDSNLLGFLFWVWG
jgi:hypothetical protein